MHLFWFLVALLSTHISYAQVLPVKQVADGIYVHSGINALPDTHNHGAIANIGFIIGERCVAVIDTGGNPQQGEALKQTINSITSKPICYVINTHVHPDHIYGNRAFKDGKTKFIGHHRLARAMANRGRYYLDKAPDQLAIQISPADIVPPDIEVITTLTIDLGKRSLTLTAHPTAHTDNDLSVYDVQTDSLWLADLLFVVHVPVIDGSATGWLKIMAQLEQHPYKTVIPGHGPVDKSWPESLQPQKQYVQTLVKQVRNAQKQGQFLETALHNIPLPGGEHWTLVEAFHRKNISNIFAELEWEENR